MKNVIINHIRDMQSRYINKLFNANLTDKQINEQEVFFNRINARKLNNKNMSMPNKKQEIIKKFNNKFDGGGFGDTKIFNEVVSFLSQTIDDIYSDIERSLPKQLKTTSLKENSDWFRNQGYNICLSQVKEIIRVKNIV